ncbi:glycosyl transferase family 10 (putative fucosyltransferase) [Neolewinella xylanilytica]|uniref:Glycosyl transferase family 10 (Putative fucosyltransferase) n=1 Tax=Neolewinella xylanilytica TaxID=1514080 RepID=A0A2S6I3Y8_9BACT|nr:glycosyltransferase family 10 [Neolewinella xylanilytica]PPK85875.1 glycosyl transferase family 10 (putative fucosyltransferase) [Neolewinella xylanilytica]
MFRPLKQPVKNVVSGLIGEERLTAYNRYARQTAGAYYQHFLLRCYGRGFYNFWRVPSFRNTWFWRFLDRPRLAKLSKDRRIAFISVFGDPRLISRINADLRVFFTGENLDFHPSYRDHLFGSVDLSLGFDQLQRSDYLRFPIWLLLCFDPGMQLADITERLRQWDRNRLDLLQRPAMVASLVASHDPSGSRRRIADLFDQVGTVRYGGAFRNVGERVPPGQAYKHRFIRQYPFHICPENSQRPGYTTEKLFEAVAAGCIPIYRGAEGAVEPDIFNQDAIIAYSPGEETVFRQRLRSLRDDPHQLRDLRGIPPFRPDAAEHIYNFYLRLEEKLFDLLG